MECRAEGGEARGTGTEASQKLALPQAEVRVGPHGPADEGALRTRRLEDVTHNLRVLPAGRPETVQGGSRATKEDSRLSPNGRTSVLPLSVGGHYTPVSHRHDPDRTCRVLPRVDRKRFLPGRQAGERQGHGPGG